MKNYLGLVLVAAVLFGLLALTKYSIKPDRDRLQPTAFGNKDPLLQELSPVNTRELAETHLDEIRVSAETADRFQKKMKSRPATDPEVTSETLEESAYVEKSLLESMTSLTQQLVNNPQMTTDVVLMLAAEDNPQTLMMIAQSLASAASMLGEAFPYQGLLDIAMHDTNPARREAALRVLAAISNPTDDLIEKVTTLSLVGPTPGIQGHAINAMETWMQSRPGLTPQLSDTLLEVRSASTDPMVRGLVIQAIGNSNAPLTESGLKAMQDAVRSESIAPNRALAAVALGSGADDHNREQVLASLESAFVAETELDNKRYIITQITKAAGPNASTYLRKLPASSDPYIIQDIADYEQIIQSAPNSSWGEIWDRKDRMDHERGSAPGQNMVH